VADITLEGHVRDLEAVADKLGLESFYLFGFYHTSLAAIIYAARHPERVKKMVLWHSYARAADRDSSRMSPVRSLRETSWEVYTETLVRTSFGWSNDATASAWAPACAPINDAGSDRADARGAGRLRRHGLTSRT
jgi:pimeloyl-ACP methyl ester carboxylesterase